MYALGKLCCVALSFCCVVLPCLSKHLKDDVLCIHVDTLFSVNIITITGSPQVIPGVSSVPFISTLLPLVLVLGVTAVKDAYDDVVSLIHVHVVLYTCFSATSYHFSTHVPCSSMYMCIYHYVIYTSAYKRQL